MSEVRTAPPEGDPDEAPRTAAPLEPGNGAPPQAPIQRAPRVKVTIHRLDGGLEDGESDSEVLDPEG